jgi:hypothetical protein
VTPFEFVLALISVITSLALTKIITGVVSIVRHQDRQEFSLTHALWIWVAFAVVVGNWGSLWNERAAPDWYSFRLFIWLVSMASLYAFCALVIPDFEQHDRLNLEEFHERDGPRYIIAHNVFALMSMLLLVVQGDFTRQGAPRFAPAVLAFALGTIAFFTWGRAQLAASTLLALLAVGFMFVNINILSSAASH